MLDQIRTHARGPAAVTLFAFTALAVAPAAQAGIVGTEQAFASPATQATLDADRAKLVATLARADVRDALVARGVDPQAVADRVAALSDDEVRLLNERIDQAPAGGELIGTLVFIFLVLLVTDLLG